ncbi:MAG TPA: SRPBCC domain-containing protein [Bacteroidia bacterium]|jgi:activator of HSP90 ATPase|nr:SRPBCC domain-containing protein [Bacteroidia bacterium]
MKTITQNVVFKNTKTATLYSMYLDSKHHTAITGGVPAKISAKEGAKFSAHDGYIIGKNLQLVKNKLIVQSWYGTDWEKGSDESTFIMLFEQKGKDAVIHMTHANIPDKHVAGIKSGWNDYYWTPWKKYLASME